MDGTDIIKPYRACEPVFSVIQSKPSPTNGLAVVFDFGLVSDLLLSVIIVWCVMYSKAGTLTWILQWKS